MGAKIKPLVYARFDTYIQVLSEKDQAELENTIKSITEALDSMDPCLAYTLESTMTFLTGKNKKTEGNATLFLDLNTIPPV